MLALRKTAAFLRIRPRWGRALFERVHGNITFLATREVLDQVNADIISGLPEGFHLAEPLTVYCGIHQKYGRHYLRRGRKLGLQTEHLLDEDGRKMRFARSRKRIEASQPFFDRVLDLNSPNRGAYRVRVPVDFGPYIFPARTPDFSEGDDSRSLFFGGIYGHRRPGILLEGQAAGRLSFCPVGTYGDVLATEIARYRAVANIHFEDGVCTEWPRILAAVLAGKPIVSERLTSDLTPGRHYVLLDDPQDFDAEKIFKQLCSRLCGNFSFAGYLLQHFPTDQDCGRIPASKSTDASMAGT